MSLDASEEHEGYSSAEDPLNSDPEDENIKKLVSLCDKKGVLKFICCFFVAFLQITALLNPF